MKALPLAAALLALALCAGRASAATAVPAPHIGTLTDAMTFPVNNGPGDQTDPHVSGRYVSYTSEESGDSAVHVYDLATQTAAAVPRPDGGLDFLSDVSGSTVTYTRLGDTSAIYQYDPSNGAESEVAPAPSPNRRESRVGGGMIAWQDFGYTNDVTRPEIAVYDTAKGTTTRLTWDTFLDKDPAVAPDGNTIVWTKCQTDGTGCTIWAAYRMPGGWGIGARTSAADGEAGLPDTDGRDIVYSVVSPSGDENIEWQPVDVSSCSNVMTPFETFAFVCWPGSASSCAPTPSTGCHSMSSSPDGETTL
jgi:Tol biopolymer transport system component